jgi:hypothetical protein
VEEASWANSQRGSPGDKACDAGKIDARVAQESPIELILPNLHKRVASQFTPVLYLLCRSWQGERLFA